MMEDVRVPGSNHRLGIGTYNLNQLGLNSNVPAMSRIRTDHISCVNPVCLLIFSLIYCVILSTIQRVFNQFNLLLICTSI